MIVTKRLLLRPVEKGDAAAIYAYSRDAAVGRNAGWKPHESLHETREIMRRVFLERPDVYAILADGRLIGTIGLIPDPKRENNETRMLGYALGVPYWGRGYMTEAARAVVNDGFTAGGYTLISAYCYPENKRSKRVLEKVGFRLEGRLALCERRYDGAVLDNECYALRREDWEP